MSLLHLKSKRICWYAGIWYKY